MSVAFFLLGLIFGSFFNVCIYRIPAGQSIVSPGSKCPHCGTYLTWADNLPVVSFVMLWARCRYCAGPISVRYPLVELLTGFLFMLEYLTFGLSPLLFLALIFVSVLLVVSFIDLDHKIIPNSVIIPSIIFGAILTLIVILLSYLSPGELSQRASDIVPLTPHRSASEAIYGLLIGFLTLLMIALIKPGGMGMGDVKLAAFMGIFLGYYVLLALFLGFLFGSVVGSFLIIALKKSRKDLIPFGPFLALGSVVTLTWGKQILDGYVAIIT